MPHFYMKFEVKKNARGSVGESSAVKQEVVYHKGKIRFNEFDELRKPGRRKKISTNETVFLHKQQCEHEFAT